MQEVILFNSTKKGAIGLGLLLRAWAVTEGRMPAPNSGSIILNAQGEAKLGPSLRTVRVQDFALNSHF